MQHLLFSAVFLLSGGVDLEEKYQEKIKYYESFLLGTCKPDDKWPYCTIDCNIEGLGKGCYVVDYPPGNKSKKYYVCQKKQSWFYFLYCNWSKDHPLSSCYGKNNCDFLGMEWTDIHLSHAGI